MGKHIVVVGGGFAGTNFIKKLGKNSNFDITLVDRNNYNFFPPLLYQVATGFLEPSNISYPFRKLLRRLPHVRLRMASLLKVVPEENKLILDNGEITYDILVFATGTESNYFGMENIRKNAIPMKTLNDAINMRNMLLQRLEQSTLMQGEEDQKKYANIVVAGGGPTGVEVSGMFAEMRKFIINKDYPELRDRVDRSKIFLVDGGDAVLAPMSKASQEDTYKALTDMGVMIKLHLHVNDYVNDEVMLSNGETIPTKTLIWTAGVTAHVFEGVPKECYGRGKRLLVDAHNKVVNTANIYAIGDTCLQTTDSGFPDGHPQVAQVALQHGKHVAENFIAVAEGKPAKPFKYFDKGSMAIIGRNKAVADIPKPKLHFKGFIAWLAWLFIHVLYLINVRNRIKTLANWMVTYFSRDQSLRMIIRPTKEEKALPDKQA